MNRGHGCHISRNFTAEKFCAKLHATVLKSQMSAAGEEPTLFRPLHPRPCRRTKSNPYPDADGDFPSASLS